MPGRGGVHCQVEALPGRARLSVMERVAILGSGNWGSAIATVIGRNVDTLPQYVNTVKMWVYEEMVENADGSKRPLTEIINTTHVNPKYLEGVVLPANIVACHDPVEAVKDATMIVFVSPHQFLLDLCSKIRRHIPKNAIGVSLIKGVFMTREGPQLISKTIREQLGGLDVSVLMGANIASEIAQGQFAESTLGFRSATFARKWKAVFDSPRFRVSMVRDVAGVELCGALKNIVAVGAGIADGLELGANAKAALLRQGLLEMILFSETYFEGVKRQTFFESCGMADLIVTCHHGRNRRVGDAFARTGKPFHQLEKELLGGQKLQGTLTAREVYEALEFRGLLTSFPLFKTIHQICWEGLNPRELITALSNQANLETSRL